MQKNRFALLLVPGVMIAALEVDAAPIRSRLLQGVSRCTEQFVDEAPEQRIMDVSNGYAWVAGTYPTCGCYCSQTAALFRAKHNRSWVLSYFRDSCSETHALLGAGWQSLLPRDLRRQFGRGLDAHSGDAVFFLVPKLPRQGTQLELTLKPIPLGMRLRCAAGICTAASNERAKTKELSDAEAASEARARYRLVQRIRHDRLILRWDRHQGRFTVVRKVRAKPQTLEAYLEACPRWQAKC